MGNTLNKAQVIANEVVTQLYNSLMAVDIMHVVSAKEFLDSSRGPTARTVNIEMPIKYEVKDGPALQLQDIQEEMLPVTIDQDKHIGLSMEVLEATLDTDEGIADMSSKYIQPVIPTLADAMDDYAMGLANKICNFSGVVGTPATYLALAYGQQKLMENGVSEKIEKSLILDPAGLFTLPDGLKGLFVREAQEGVSKGRIGHAVGVNIYGSNNVRRHTAGTLGAGALSNGVDQTGSTINIDGLDANDNVQVGDIITFAGTYAVNPVNKRTQSSLKQFVVTEAAVAAGGAIAVKISPEVITTGAYQNVSQAVADGSAVVIKATHTKNMLIIKDTLCLATVPLKAPKTAKIAATASYKGLNVLLTGAYDIQTRKEIIRVDCVYGGRELLPYTGCIVGKDS